MARVPKSLALEVLREDCRSRCPLNSGLICASRVKVAIDFAPGEEPEVYGTTRAEEERLRIAAFDLDTQEAYAYGCGWGESGNRLVCDKSMTEYRNVPSKTRRLIGRIARLIA